MAAIINIEDVKLKTLQVELKVLTLTGKQMSLSVFKQLPEGKLINDDYSLAGVPWGKVNYFWKDNDACSLHVVWQKDKTLFRSACLAPKKPADIKWKVDREIGEKESLRKICATLKRDYEADYPGVNIMDTTTWKSGKYKDGMLAIRECEKEIKTLTDEYNAAIVDWASYKRIYDELDQLPQLFIAA